MQRQVHLDYNTTTPVHPELLDEMLPFPRNSFGNPSSIHWAGRSAKQAVELARERVAGLVTCDSSEAIFTSCATESNNTAIKSLSAALRSKGNHLVTTMVEHPAVITPCLYQEHQGDQTTCLDVNSGHCQESCRIY